MNGLIVSCVIGLLSVRNPRGFVLRVLNDFRKKKKKGNAHMNESYYSKGASAFVHAYNKRCSPFLLPYSAGHVDDILHTIAFVVC